MCSYAQENINMIKILDIEQDIISLEKRITSLVKKKPEIANIRGLRQFHVFGLYSGNSRKEDFLNRSFLYKLSLGGYYDIKSNFLFWKRRKYIKAQTSITDSVGNLVARGDARLVHVAPVFGQYNIELAKMFFDKEIDFVFDLGFPYSSRYMVGIKGNNLYALQNTKEGLKVYPWDEFMQCCYDEWVFQGKRQE
jgi:hypothetical protein